jgi:hypothetical protein
LVKAIPFSKGTPENKQKYSKEGKADESKRKTNQLIHRGAPTKSGYLYDFNPHIQAAILFARRG